MRALHEDDRDDVDRRLTRAIYYPTPGMREPLLDEIAYYDRVGCQCVIVLVGVLLCANVWLCSGDIVTAFNALL